MTLITFCGMPGTGKTYLSRQIHDYLNDKENLPEIKKNYPQIYKAMTLWLFDQDMSDEAIRENQKELQDLFNLMDFTTIKYLHQIVSTNLNMRCTSVKLLEEIVTKKEIIEYYDKMDCPDNINFLMQIKFLNLKVVKIGSKGVFLQDRSFDENFLFARNQYHMNRLTQEEFEIYKGLFDVVKKLIKPPDIMIYLDVEYKNIIKNIKKRDGGEKVQDQNYWTRLNDLYYLWRAENIQNLLIIDNNCWVDFREVLDKVNKAL